jgi:hypothetical protein
LVDRKRTRKREEQVEVKEGKKLKERRNIFVRKSHSLVAQSIDSTF